MKNTMFSNFSDCPIFPSNFGNYNLINSHMLSFYTTKTGDKNPTSSYNFTTSIEDLSMDTKEENFVSIEDINLETGEDTPIKTNSSQVKSETTTPLRRVLRLPNEMKMAELLLKKNLTNYKFDLVTEEWFTISKETPIWKNVTKFQMDQKIYLTLKSFKDLDGILTTDYILKVKNALKLLAGTNLDEIRKNNKELKLIPFKNGVYNLQTQTLSNHDKNLYFTYFLNLDYNPKAKLSQDMINFLLSISNYNRDTLKVLRSFIQCVLLRDNQYQVALYLHGPGGTGKSTFEKLLISLVGSKNSSVLNLEDINKTFTLSKIVDKSLILFSDVQSYTGDPSKLRLLISGDILSVEKKYKDPFDLQPDALVVLSSNMIWSPKDTSTGLQRRIIYIPVTRIPEKVDRNLFSFDMVTNQGSGKLEKSLPGLVNWALGNDPNNLKLLDNAVWTNNLISPNTLEDTNPLISWIKTYLTYENGGAVSVGKKTSNPETNLYPHYLGFCKDYGFTPLSFNLFTTVLLQQLNVLISPTIQKKRITAGVIIQHLKLNNQPILEEDPNNPNLKSSDNSIMEEFHNFTEDY